MELHVRVLWRLTFQSFIDGRAGAYPRKRQTATASPAKPGELPFWIEILHGLEPPPKRSSVLIGDEIAWSQCPDVETVPGRCSGAWVVKGTRALVQGILDNFEAGCSAEEIAGPDVYDLPLDVMRRILAFAAESVARARAMTDQNDLPCYFSSEDQLSALLLQIEQERNAAASWRYRPARLDPPE